MVAIPTLSTGSESTAGVDKAVAPRGLLIDGETVGHAAGGFGDGSFSTGGCGTGGSRVGGRGGGRSTAGGVSGVGGVGGIGGRLTGFQEIALG